MATTRKAASRPQETAVGSPRRKPPPRTPWLEKAAAAIGLALTLLAVGFVGREALFGDRSAPAIVLRPGAVETTPQGYVLAVTARNEGGRPAAQVRVEGELALPGAEPETAEATFDYVPDHSSRQGGLIFQGDPAAGAVTLRATGFVEP